MEARWWWCTPLIPAFGRKRQEEFCEFEASLDSQSYKKLSRKKKQEKNEVEKDREIYSMATSDLSPPHTQTLIGQANWCVVKRLPCKSDNLKRCVHACMYTWCGGRLSKVVFQSPHACTHTDTSNTYIQ